MIAHGLNWREPTTAERVVYAVTDSAEVPPVLITFDVIKVSVSDTNSRVVIAGYPESITVISRRHGQSTLQREVACFTAADAWAVYITSQESIIDDLQREVEVREKYRRMAVAEHAKVGPSGPAASYRGNTPAPEPVVSWDDSCHQCGYVVCRCDDVSGGTVRG